MGGPLDKKLGVITMGSGSLGPDPFEDLGAPLLAFGVLAAQIRAMGEQVNQQWAGRLGQRVVRL
ncbi:MAG: hypothetical protein M3319_05450 [Actinomycetota bacterium]|nr:hypothetical protein [Actinomycetota bacterium]MDQ3899905.1 hypothetical protein [Actinomycetota bacterium]